MHFRAVVAWMAVAYLAACAPAGRAAARGPRPSTASVTDVERRLDVNALNVWISNLGAWGHDIIGAHAGGALYPRGTEKPLLYAAGLWLGASVSGATRVTAAEYSSEYRPGRMFGASPDDPALPRYRVWKVRAWSGDPTDTAHVERTPAELAADPTADPIVHHGWSEYLAAAAVDFGSRLHRLPDTQTPAPDDSVDVLGPPTRGDWTAFAVWNDADPVAHTASPGSTAPLGVEVFHTAYAFESNVARGMVFHHWRIVNRGGSLLDSLIAGAWLDPDLGGFTDDLVGCDTTLHLGYAYNATNNDLRYGGTPPATGFQWLASQRGAAIDTLPSGAFVRLINGADPVSARESWNLLNGLTRAGAPWLDPDSGTPTRFMLAGNPIAPSPQAWLDSGPADRRFVLSTKPTALGADEVLELDGVFLVGQGPSRLASVANLAVQAANARALFHGREVACCAEPDNCPRRSSYWHAQCGPGAVVSAEDLDRLALLLSSSYESFDWPTHARDSLCATLTPGGSIRDEALREFATLALNGNAHALGVIPAQGRPIHLDPALPVSVPPARGTVLSALLDPAIGESRIAAAYDDRDSAHGVPFAPIGDGVTHALSFLASSLDPRVHPDSFPDVEIRFDPSSGQRAHRFLRLQRQSDGLPPTAYPDRGYLYAGLHDQPFSVWDVNAGVRLDCAFVERTLTDDFGSLLPPESQPPTFDFQWAPDTTSDGGREYLLILRRPYSGFPNSSITFDGAPRSLLRPWLYAINLRRLAADALADAADRYVIDATADSGLGVQSLLHLLERDSISNPAVIAAYESLRDGLARLNAGEGMQPICDDPTPALASLERADADPTGAHLVWRVNAAGEVIVQRRIAPGAWTFLAARLPDGEGRVVLDDGSLAPGATAAYRLALGVGGSAPYAGEVTLSRPGAAALTLAGPRPNPVSRSAVITFTLAVRGNADLEVFDVSGRRVWHRRFVAAAPGTHDVVLDARRLAPGIHLLRLRAAGTERVRRAIIVP